MKSTLNLQDTALPSAWAEIFGDESPAALLKPQAYRLAFADPEFLLRRETRGIRFQLKMLKPDLAQQAAGIHHTVVVYGSARFVSEAQAQAQLQAAQASGEAEEEIEPAPVRQVVAAIGAVVPLSDESGGVAGVAEVVTEGPFGQIDPVEPAVARHVDRARAVVVAPREVAGAGRGAERRGRIVIGEAHAPFRQRIERRRVHDRIAIAAEVAPAEIVGEDEEDVRAGFRRRGGATGRGHAEAHAEEERERGSPHVDEPVARGFTRTAVRRAARSAAG